MEQGLPGLVEGNLERILGEFREGPAKNRGGGVAGSVSGP